MGRVPSAPFYVVVFLFLLSPLPIIHIIAGLCESGRAEFARRWDNGQNCICFRVCARVCVRVHACVICSFFVFFAFSGVPGLSFRSRRGGGTKRSVHRCLPEIDVTSGFLLLPLPAFKKNAGAPSAVFFGLVSRENVLVDRVRAAMTTPL